MFPSSSTCSNSSAAPLPQLLPFGGETTYAHSPLHGPTDLNPDFDGGHTNGRSSIPRGSMTQSTFPISCGSYLNITGPHGLASRRPKMGNERAATRYLFSSLKGCPAAMDKWIQGDGPVVCGNTNWLQRFTALTVHVHFAGI